MLTKKQLEIFAIFNKNVFREYTFNKLKKIAKQNSNSIIQNAIKAFKEENLINERQIGNIKLYSLNHNNDRIYNYLILTIKLPKQIQKAVDNYIQYLKDNKTEDKYIKHGSTFFNNWEDYLVYESKTRKERCDF